jgi:signal peptidase II
VFTLPLENFRRPLALARFFLTTIAGLSLDLWTKQLAFATDPYNIPYMWATPHRAQALGDEIRFIPGWLHFTVTTNEGAVFGFGQGYRWLFICVSVLAILFLTWLFANSGRQRFYQFTLGLLLAGVLGNMYDRIMFGHVRDMIHILPQWKNLFYYIFNVADVMLCTGVGLLVLTSLMGGHEEPATQTVG